jgi:hypothetical protein
MDMLMKCGCGKAQCQEGKELRASADDFLRRYDTALKEALALRNGLSIALDLYRSHVKTERENKSD